MVIIIVPELESDDVELVGAAASILGPPSLPAGSAAPGEEAPPKNKKIAKTEAKHRNLTARLNISSNPRSQSPLDSRDLFSQKKSFPRTTHPLNLASFINVPSSHLGPGASSHTLRPL